MYRVAICDNDETCAENVKQMVMEFMGTKNLECEVTIFQDSVKLAEVLKDCTFDIFILNPVMPKISGLELGRIIRDKDKMASIIYVASSKEYAYDAFKVQTIGYLLKPVPKEEFFFILDSAYRICIYFERSRIGVKTKEGSFVAIYVEDIVAVENVARRAEYILRDGTSVMSSCNRSTFEKSIEPISKHTMFVQPHKSFFINMMYIKEIKQDELVMDNEMVVPISRERLQNVKKMYKNFLQSCVS